MSLHTGRDSPTTRPMMMEPMPEPTPLIITISSGSLFDRQRVQLFSRPQHTQAASTNSEPNENWKLPASSTDSRMLDRVISPIAIHSFSPIFSFKSRKTPWISPRCSLFSSSLSLTSLQHSADEFPKSPFPYSSSVP